MRQIKHMRNNLAFGLDSRGIWDTVRAFEHLRQQGLAHTKRTAERRLHEIGLLPPELSAQDLTDEHGQKPTATVLNWEIGSARRRRDLVLFAQLFRLPGGAECVHLNSARGARCWLPLRSKKITAQSLAKAFQQLSLHFGKDLLIYPHGALVETCRDLPTMSAVKVSLLAYPPVLGMKEVLAPTQVSRSRGMTKSASRSPHLRHLENESIHIIREAYAESLNPVMLYSIGKDSSVLMHLARKAFFPAAPPFPLLHVDTRWKFREMYLFRERLMREGGMKLLVHTNPEAIERDINPFDHGSAIHTDITKTEGLKQALDLHQFDLAFGGARRDEEKSRSKERIFSFRSANHHWEPKNQRPELWNLFNASKVKGDSIRVFPLSNWTELDIWQYIYQEEIPIVPLYFAKVRPVVQRGTAS
jgi:sulfate adenylyltransferase subunit 2